MHKLVILGSGFGGLTVFHHVSRWARAADVHVTVVDERETFVLKPSLPEVAVGEKRVEDVLFSIRPVVQPHGEFVCDRIERIDAGTKRVLLSDGGAVPYDTLVIALGAHKDFAGVNGFLEHGFSMCTDVLAPRLSEAISRFPGGRVVIGSAPMLQGTRTPDVPQLRAACEGPVGEIAFMLDAHLRHGGLRDRSQITCFSPASIFFEDVGDKVHRAFATFAGERGIEIETNKEVVEIMPDRVRFLDGSERSSDLTIIIPSYRGPDLITASELGDEAGFVPTDHEFRHLDHPDIFAIGDCAARTVPKLGHLAVEQGVLVAERIRMMVTGRESQAAYVPEVFCIMNMGMHKAMLIRSNTLYGGTMDIAYYGTVSSLMKTAFDEYMLRFHGKTPPELAQRWLNVWLSRLDLRGTDSTA
ncbi:MAG: FAD-dependent oxidoreductase [Firmicutes bacterium]|nr:FAD-dependent oxidoreductase [Bacillota bacterium]